MPLPENTEPDWLHKGISHIWQPYAQAKTAPRPLAVQRTEGCYIILEDGRRLIDGISSWWSTPHGHNHPHLIEAAKKQLDIMPNVMFAGLAHEPAYRLATRLVNITPASLSRVFFSDSGSTAVEVALKIALQYWVNTGKPEKRGFICLSHAYHGDTFGAMSVSDPARGMHHAYLPNIIPHPALDVPQNEEELNRFESEISSFSPYTAALIIEPLVQGAGGMRFYPASSLRIMAEICKRYDILLIADEIMTGFGRLGTMFACDEAGISPDIMCIGKGLTGGVMTLAATLASEEIYQAFYDEDNMKALMHGPTFMGNPLACSIANASLDLFETEPRLPQAHKIAGHFHSAFASLSALPHVQDIRIKGALAAIELEPAQCNPFLLRKRFVELGCWLRPYKNIIYAMPPLVITSSQLRQLSDAIITLVHESAAK